ncbi:LacI family DNA-binding transcriptional regulator [Schumannella luteola]
MTTAATQRPTLAAVAARAGVSASTASLAFSGAGPVSEATRARVIAAAEELGYAGPDPRAQSLRKGRSGIIGVVMEDRLQYAFSDPVNVAVLEGVADELGPAGFALLLLTDTAESVAGIGLAPMDGVILIGCSRDLDVPVTAFRQRGVAMVAIEAEPLEGVVPIDLDNRDATARGAEHLRDLGHERVGLVTLPLGPAHETQVLTDDLIDGSKVHTTIQRILGAHDVFPAAPGIVAAGFAAEDGLVAGRELLASHPDITAVIAQSDLLALGVIRAAEEVGMRVPDDLSVLGFDGIRLDGTTTHELTTLVQPSVEKGRAAGRAAVAMVEGGDARPESFTSELRLGTTTAAPRT